VIQDVATTGNSGSGVFAAGGKCLLGLMSRKFFIRPIGPNVETRDIAKYFVPAATIAASRFFYEIFEFIFAHTRRLLSEPK
jgi:hypothetical protein